MLAENFRGKAYDLFSRERAVGPNFKRELIVIGALTDSRAFYVITYFFNRRIDRIDRNVIYFFRLVVFCAFITSVPSYGNFHIEYSAFIERADVRVLVEYFNFHIGRDISRKNDRGTRFIKP